MADLKVQFRPGALADDLKERSEAEHGIAYSATVMRDLERYYGLLSLALMHVDLTEGEAGFLVDICNGTLFSPFSVAAQSLQYEVEDADPEYDGKWDVDRADFVDKLRSYSLLERAAICDAIERFWGDAYHVENTRARLVRVGLIK